MLKKNLNTILAFSLVMPLFTACGIPLSNVNVESVNIIDNISDALAKNTNGHEDSTDYVWSESDVISITLSDNSSKADTNKVNIANNKITIKSAGTYKIKGSLSDGQIIVDSDSKDIVKLIFDGVNISNSKTAPIFIKQSQKTIIALADNSENNITDGSNYENSQEDEPNAAIFSKDDLTITGNGSLNVNGNYNDGIASKDGLIINGGKLTINSIDDGIRGKDYLIIKDGNINVKTKGDGLKSSNEDDTGKGYIYIQNGEIVINSYGDAITAESDVLISNGKFTIDSGESNTKLDEDTSAKGIKAVKNIIIDSGSFTITSIDDTIHSNEGLTINNGDFVLSSGDDGIHADTNLKINNGNINIKESYEGIESQIITINNGNINIISSDDGLNVAGGKDGSGEVRQFPTNRPQRDNGNFPSPNPNQSGMPPQFDGNFPSPNPDQSGMPPQFDGNFPSPNPDQSGMPPQFDGNFPSPNPDQSGMPPQFDGNRPQGGMADDGRFVTSETNNNYYLYINGGSITVNANGDGIDSNGSIIMTDGKVIVNGPTDTHNGSLDYDVAFKITGGFLLAAGSFGMVQAPDKSSSQHSVLFSFAQLQTANTLVHIQDSNGKEIFSFAPAKNYQAVTFSSPDLQKGSTYDIYYGGTSTGNISNGLYTDGKYTAGNKYTSFTISDITTKINNR